MNSNYIIDHWKDLTNKWWKKVLIISIAFFLLIAIYLLQPRFGKQITPSLDFLSLSFEHVGTITSQDNKHLIYRDKLAISEIKDIEIICKNRSFDYIIKIDDAVIEVMGFPFPRIIQKSGSYTIIYDNSIYFNIEDEKELVIQGLVSDIYSNDIYDGWSIIVTALAILLSLVIGFLNLFYCDAWTLFGIIGRPVLVNCITGVLFILVAFVFSFGLQ